MVSNCQVFLRQVHDSQYKITPGIKILISVFYWNLFTATYIRPFLNGILYIRILTTTNCTYLTNTNITLFYRVTFLSILSRLNVREIANESMSTNDRIYARNMRILYAVIEFGCQKHPHSKIKYRMIYYHPHRIIWVICITLHKLLIYTEINWRER